MFHMYSVLMLPPIVFAAPCRAECEDQLRAEFRIEMNAAVAESEQRWQTREQELQTQISELQGQLTQVRGHSRLGPRGL